MKLDGVTEAIAEAKRLLVEARTVKRPAIHIVHDAGPGTPCDVAALIGKIVDSVAPQDGGTLAPSTAQIFTKIASFGVQGVGFGRIRDTHMCNSTARSAFEPG